MTAAVRETDDKERSFLRQFFVYMCSIEQPYRFACRLAKILTELLHLDFWRFINLIEHKRPSVRLISQQVCHVALALVNDIIPVSVAVDAERVREHYSSTR